MANSAVEPLEAFCRRHGVMPPFETRPIRAGRNSEVSLLSNKDGRWILKNYHQPAGADQRDRLGTEYGFLLFLANAGVPGVPRPLGMDRSLHVALYSYLPGRRPGAINSAYISQAAGFIGQINRFRTTAEAMALPAASDACLSGQAHMELTQSRIDRLLAVEPDLVVELEAREFVQTCLLPLWTKLKIELTLRGGLSEPAAPLPPEDRIISPSDFGFHNTLEHEGRLFFVDFEYSGWDDPAKLICDFMCQPELPVMEEQGRQFMNELLRELPRAEAVQQRVELFLPAHRIKWCCILLNEFRMEDRKRRIHAGLAADGLLAEQLGKAKNYFGTHLADLI